MKPALLLRIASVATLLTAAGHTMGDCSPGPRWASVEPLRVRPMVASLLVASIAGALIVATLIFALPAVCFAVIAALPVLRSSG